MIPFSVLYWRGHFAGQVSSADALSRTVSHLDADLEHEAALSQSSLRSMRGPTP